MAHANLSPDLIRFIETAEANNGFYLNKLPENSMFEIHTKNNVYTVVVMDPVKRAIALMGTRHTYEEPGVYGFLGSSFGLSTSTLKLGWVGVGLHFRMQTLDGQLI